MSSWSNRILCVAVLLAMGCSVNFAVYHRAFKDILNGITTTYSPETGTRAVHRSHDADPEVTRAALAAYEKWKAGKQPTFNDTCHGWVEYKDWIEAYFNLAPPAPNCQVVESFFHAYNQTWSVPGTLVLRRNAQGNHSTGFAPALAMSWSGLSRKLRGRANQYAAMWKNANLRRNLPPSSEIFLYTNDKPRGPKHLGLPGFSVSGEFPVGSGLPTKWMNYVPFPSQEFSVKIPKEEPSDFQSKRPILYFRGRFSENTWGRFHTHKHHWSETPRFKLALATSNPADQDVLDVKMTGFGHGNATKMQDEIRESLWRDYNISMANWSNVDDGNSRYRLAVSGNGWAGATTMKSLVSGSATFFVNDTSTCYEGYTRDLGEIYFPLLKPDKDLVVVDYDTIAPAVRKLNADPEKAERLAKAGFKFSQRFLGMECALDVIELLAWRYYVHVSSGCPRAFSHVDLKEFT